MRDEALRQAAKALLDDIQIEIDAKGGTKRQSLARLELSALRFRAVLDAPYKAPNCWRCEDTLDFMGDPCTCLSSRE